MILLTTDDINCRVRPRFKANQTHLSLIIILFMVVLNGCVWYNVDSFHIQVKFRLEYSLQYQLEVFHICISLNQKFKFKHFSSVIDSEIANKMGSQFTKSLCRFDNVNRNSIRCRSNNLSWLRLGTHVSYFKLEANQLEDI